MFTSVFEQSCYLKPLVTFLTSAVTVTKSNLFSPRFRDSSGGQKKDTCRKLNFEEVNIVGASSSIMPEKLSHKKGCVFSTTFV